MSEMEPIIKVYVKTGLKFKTGDFFTVEKIRAEDDSYVLEPAFPCRPVRKWFASIHLNTFK